MGRVLKEELLKYNDYELLYLVSMGNEDAQNILFGKYLFMVKKMISRFNVPSTAKDDYEQEGMLMINKAIKTYKHDSKMTFTRYVEMLIYHRFIDLERHKNKRNEEMVSLDSIDYIIDSSSNTFLLQESSPFDMSKLSEREHKVYELKFIKGLPSQRIAEELAISISQVYATTDRIKRKLRLQNK